MEQTNKYHEASPQDASKLIPEASPVFVGDMVYTEDQQEVRTTSNIASIHKTPANLTPKQLLDQTKEHNKGMKKNPPKLSTQNVRPEITDTEIAFIHATFFTVPVTIIAHTLGITEARVKELHTQTNHHLLPTLPLLMVTDTSRYLNDEELRNIKEFDDLNHFEDLRTSKELLRIPQEESTNTKILKDYISTNLKEADSQVQLFLRNGYCKLPQDSTEESIGLYGNTEFDITRGFKGTFNEDSPETNQLNFINYHTSSYKSVIYKKVKYVNLAHPSYFQKYNYKTPRQSIELANLLIPYIVKNTDYDKQNILGLPIYLSVHTNNALNSIITRPTSYQTIEAKNQLTNYNTTLKYHNSINNKEAYLSEFNKETNTFTTVVHFQYVLPYTNERSLGSPLLDSNRNLRYTPINLSFLPANKVVKDSSVNYAVVCHTCSSLLSKDTVTHCPHIRLTINQYRAALPKRKPNNRVLRLTTKYDYTFSETHKDIYTIYLDTSNPPIYSLHYYTTLPPHLVTNNLKIQEYITKVSPNILPLFTSIAFPIASTLQEPHLS